MSLSAADIDAIAEAIVAKLRVNEEKDIERVASRTVLRLLQSQERGAREAIAYSLGRLEP